MEIRNIMAPMKDDLEKAKRLQNQRWIRGMPLLKMQHSEMAHINFQKWVFVSKNAVSRILKLDQK